MFVRHGTHDRLDRILCGRMPGVSLGADGRAQAARIADRLAQGPVDGVWSSPLERARETAAPIAAAHGLTAEVAEDLQEIDVGDWTGLSFAALDADPAWRRWNLDRGHARAGGGGESMLEVQVRVERWMATALRTPGEGALVAVCHADVIKAAVCVCLGLALDLLHRFEIQPGSASTILVGDFGRRALAINERPA